MGGMLLTPGTLERVAVSSMRQLRRGEFVDGDELLQELDVDNSRGPSGS